MDEKELNKNLEVLDRFCAFTISTHAEHKSEYFVGIRAGVKILKVRLDEVFKRRHQFEGYSLDSAITVEEINRGKTLDALTNEISQLTLWEYTRDCKNFKDFKHQISLLKQMTRKEP